VLVVVLAVAIGVGGVWVVLFSSVLAVEDVKVTGVETVGSQQVRDLVDVRDGTPLARVDLGGIRTRVGALAPVASVDVRRQWPHGLVVDVTERVPVAVVSIGQQLRSLDAQGVVFGSYDKAPAGLPRIDTVEGTRSDALREAATVVSALPQALARRVDHAEVQTVDQVVLVLRDGRRVQWGSADDSALKAQVLGVLLAQEGTTYDVSVPGQPTVR
jgi:cell division protein FtsQ